MNIELHLTEPQERFVFSDSVHPGMVAGYGAGKSQAGAVRLLMLALQYEGMSFAFVEPTFDLVRLIAWPRFTGLLDEWGIKHSLNKGTSILEIENGSNIIFRSGDNPERLVGFEVADAVVDEADTLRPQQAAEVWHKMLGRARQRKPDGKKNTVAAVSTPEGFGWMYETFGRELRPGYELIRAPTSSNPYLPAGYLDTLTATYPANLLLAYSEGQFVNLTSGSIYAEFDRALNRSTETIQVSDHLHIGMDFNVGQMAGAVFVLRDGDPHGVDEITGVLDTPAMIATIKSRYQGHSIMVYPDASGGGRRSNNASESDISLLRSAGFTILAPAANPPVKNRILAMNQMIHCEGVRRLKVNVDRCPMLVEALEKQAYDKNGEPDKTSGLDHINDACGYLIHYKFPVAGRGISRVRIGGV